MRISHSTRNLLIGSGTKPFKGVLFFRGGYIFSLNRVGKLFTYNVISMYALLMIFFRGDLRVVKYLEGFLHARTPKMFLPSLPLVNAQYLRFLISPPLLQLIHIFSAAATQLQTYWHQSSSCFLFKKTYLGAIQIVLAVKSAMFPYVLQ